MRQLQRFQLARSLFENYSVQFRLYSVLYPILECHDWSAAPTSYLVARALGHAAAFSVNTALVASQWRCRA